MFTHLRIRNLKSMADSGLLTLRPLTFLMGPNSSGKSTLIQALLLARQTVDSRDVGNPLVVDGKYVKLGSYQEFIHRHDRSKRLSLEFGMRSRQRLLLDPRTEVWVDSAVVSAEFYHNQKTSEIYSTEVTAKMPEAESAVSIRRISRENSTARIEFRGRSVETKVPSSGKFYDVVKSPFPLEFTTRRFAEAGVDAQWRSAFRMLPFAATRLFESQFMGTFYLGPLRTSPQRTYVMAGETPQDVGLQGEATSSILWAARWKKALKQGVLQPAGAWLQRFGIAEGLELKRIGGSYFTLLLTDPTTKVTANFADVGFGASQLLPAIVETLFAPEGSTVIMEQPEIHLHPAAQAVLGDLFLAAVTMGKQLIIETHSDHLVSRVMRRIGEGNFDRNRVALYYCNPTEAGTEVLNIEIDDFGQFGGGLPNGFFEQAYRESLAHVEAVAKRSSGDGE